MSAWEPHRPRTPKTRVLETSPCGTYEWCEEGGQYLILRRSGTHYDETGRGLHAEAREVWKALTGRK
ncbi:hypothetical protein [Nonomuraea typhae]|uniref:hypothetical protein n=1 Tax=Nonomuraea typhae TaxID=2603600 RepID=UPI0012FCC2B6|nr:hypothetical protein [Nonomuraea typhae]